ncbi:S-M checkpoint control rad4-like protein [Cladobotryum mycophilum]|uniref:S-M checkpoint control rad4-like protein n=1 Tax=Cladobotryum mycophilum TaxID=491253 RepID=A0ABR0SQP2_9HYPO
MASSRSPEAERLEIDPSEPFKGVIICCTSIPPEQRVHMPLLLLSSYPPPTDIAQKVVELGGIHKYDLTPDVTHLIVGDYDTPKYRHVARERPDIKAMDAGWVDAVNEVWKNDDPIDYLVLEKHYQLRPLETCGAEPASQEDSSAAARGSLLICLTGFGDQREDIAEKIKNAGGRHTGDLTRRCTHLIVSKPEGKKFTAAKSWGVHTVTLDWLYQSIERGMALEEGKFDPMLPPEEQGVGAWIRKDPRKGTLGKRSRSAVNPGAAEDGTRKLRKTASMKLSFQRSNIWGDILGTSGSKDYSFVQENQPDVPIKEEVPTQPGYSLVQEDQGVFANCIFVILGFPRTRAAILEQTVTTMGGSIARSLADPTITSNSGDGQVFRFLAVPQTSQPDTHPQVPHDNVHVITEFYIENCLHNKRFFSPDEQVLGRPFPSFPIPGFSNLIICSAAFTGIELNQVSRGVSQLGAKYEEAFRKTTSVLVCKSLESVRKEKLKLALSWGVPVVPGDWLWECISTGFLAPIDDFIYPELKRRYATKRALDKSTSKVTPQNSDNKPATKNSGSGSSKPPVSAGVDTTAFDHDSPEKSKKKSTGNLLKVDSVTSADFMTAPTRPVESFFTRPTDLAPLAELSSAALNKSPRIAAKPHATGPNRAISNPFADSDSEDEAPAPDSAPSISLPETKEPSKEPSPQPQEQGADEPKEDLERDKEKEKEQEKETEISHQVAKEEKTKQAKAAEVRQGLTSALSGLIQPVVGVEAQEADRPRRRRHKILGRAVSNVSNASSAASNDSNRPTLEGLRDEDEEPAQPPGTQLEYGDPEAQEYKAALMMLWPSGNVDDMWVWALDREYDAGNATSSDDGQRDGKYRGVLRVRLQQLVNDFFQLRRLHEEEFDVPGLLKYADWANLMSYDLHGVWDEHNSIGSIIQSHTNLTEIKLAVDLLWRSNVPPGEIVFGVGFYGRSFQLKGPSYSSPGCQFGGPANAGVCTKSAGTLAYFETMDITDKEKPNIVHDEKGAANYIVFGDNKD